MPTKADQVIAYASREIGKPYSYGAQGPGEFDCSGLMLYAFGLAGVSLPRTSQEQQRYAQPVTADQARPGDLVFWGSPAHHVALYLGGGRILYAPQEGDVVKVGGLYGSPTFGRVPGVGGTIANVVDVGLVQPVVWGVDTIRKTAGDVGLLVVACLGGAALIGLGAWQTTTKGRTP